MPIYSLSKPLPVHDANRGGRLPLFRSTESLIFSELSLEMIWRCHSRQLWDGWVGSEQTVLISSHDIFVKLDLFKLISDCLLSQ
jgi:hypothetical protein